MELIFRANFLHAINKNTQCINEAVDDKNAIKVHTRDCGHFCAGLSQNFFSKAYFKPFGACRHDFLFLPSFFLFLILCFKCFLLFFLAMVALGKIFAQREAGAVKGARAIKPMRVEHPLNL